MSTYEDYTATAPFYDRTRQPVGVEVILGCLAVSGLPLPRQTVLDAGCGTGAYAAELLDHVEAVVGVDADAGMLAAAADRLGDAVAGEQARLHQATLDALPLESASVDGGLVNQVLHHLPDRAAVRAALEEIARVLRPGGSLVIGTSSWRQATHGFWFYALLAPAIERLRQRLLDVDELGGLLVDAGFAPPERIVPLDAVLQGEAYFDGEGPLREEWRRGDSVWALLEPDELQAVLDHVGAMRRQGTLDDYVREHDAQRRDVGQVTFLVARRDE